MSTKGSRHLTSFLVCVLIILAFTTPAGAQTDERFFPETGHYVRGKFLEFYLNHPDPQLVFGYPITDAFPSATDGLIIQYFEKVRFELNPDKPEGLQVKLSPLGKYLHTKANPLPLPKNFPPCQKLQENGMQVCYAFLDFFNAQGGVDLFGYPISNFELRDERIVQYFQNVRFEWHPELPPGQRVVVSNLGKRYFQQFETQARADYNANSPQVILDLHTRVFTQDSVSPLKGEQTITALVRDQNQQAVANAQVFFTIRLPNGREMKLPIEVKTDGNGLAKVTISYESPVPGIIELLAEARLGTMQAPGRGSFRVW